MAEERIHNEFDLWDLNPTLTSPLRKALILKADKMMKKYVFIIPSIIVVVAAISFIILSQDNNVVDLEPQNNSQKTQDTITSDKSVSNTDTKPTITIDKQEDKVTDTDKIADTPKETEDYNWLNEEVQIPKQQQKTDAFSVELARQKAIADGTYIDNPETMDPDALHSAIEKQLISRFGNIPQVQTHMKYMRLRRKGVRLTLDETIEDLQAGMFLFPNGSTRRTLAYHVWMRDKGFTPDKIPELNEADIKHLRSKGITIERQPTGDGRYQIRVSTK